MANDLAAHRGASLVIAGEEQPPAVHALAHAMNAALGNVGKTVYYTDPLEANPVNEMESLRDLVNDINAGKVDLLLMLGGNNPVYDAPVDFDFGPALLKVKTRVHSGLYYDETAELCHWHVPAAHFLESWGDARAFDGTVGMIQPLIQPLYDGHSAYEIVGVLAGDAGKSGHDIVQDYWKSVRPEKDKAFEAYWERSLHDGLMAGTALPAISVALRGDIAQQVQNDARRTICKSPSAPIPQFSTAASPTTAGCRNCPSRTRNSPGTTPRCSVPPRRSTSRSPTAIT